MRTRENPSDLDHEIVIVGSGFGGMGVAIKLKDMGIDDFVILERADDLGGTWRDNTYPGLAVDVASMAYSYSFEPNPDWSRVYARGPEIWAYADHCAEKYDIKRHIRFGQNVARAVYDEDANTWTVRIDGGTSYVCRYFISATGALVTPKMPNIEGADAFKGKVIHTARRDHEHDLSGERVAVIGTGATAIQLIPEIVPKVKQLDVYQRTPIWLLPKFDGEISDAWKKAFRYIPGLQRLGRLSTNAMFELLVGGGFNHYKGMSWLFNWLERQATAHIRRQVNDPAVQEKLIPDYTFFCKRASFTNDYFPVFNRENVELVTDPIARITESGIVTADGTVREIDTMICATGFSVFEKGVMPGCEVVGRGGKELGQYWEDTRLKAFKGITVPDFPNYFMIFGPYAIASFCYFGMIDAQVRHLSRCLKAAKKRGANCIEVRRSAFDDDFREILKRRESQVLYRGNCASSNTYYYDRNGDGPLLRPATHVGTWFKSHFISMNNYEFASRA
jgi:cation diffusion facilitator CzcD-associated flavoprotein CzcO